MPVCAMFCPKLHLAYYCIPTDDDFIARRNTTSRVVYGAAIEGENKRKTQKIPGTPLAWATF